MNFVKGQNGFTMFEEPKGKEYRNMIKRYGVSHSKLTKEAYSGSYQGMRYYYKSFDKEHITAYVYPEPKCFEATPEEEKISKEFPLSDEGLNQVYDWLNEVYVGNIEKWQTACEKTKRIVR